MPCKDWVAYRWLPFDERDLYAELGLDRRRAWAWIKNDREHTFAQLLVRQGKSPEAVANRLVAKRRPRVPRSRASTLRRRALQVLTQGHLAQHIMFHQFHHVAPALHTRRLFGVSPLEYRRLRLLGESPYAIARRGHQNPKRLARRVMNLMRRYASRGVRAGAVSRAQADRTLRHQNRHLRSWLHSGMRPRPAKRPDAALGRKQLVCYMLTGRTSDEDPSRAEGVEPAR